MTQLGGASLREPLLGRRADDALIEAWRWRSPRLRALDDTVVRLLGDPPARVLDVGCGSGRLSSRLGVGGFDVDGIDLDEMSIAFGKRILERNGVAGVELYTGDVREGSGPVAHGGYDAVVCVEVLSRVDDWREILQRSIELLRPGGQLIVWVPRDPKQLTKFDSGEGILRRFREGQIVAQLKDSCDEIYVRCPGWPLMRTWTWLKTVSLTLGRRSPSEHRQRFWREPSALRHWAVGACYTLVKLDDAFARLPLGTHVVVRARKRPDA